MKHPRRLHLHSLHCHRNPKIQICERLPHPAQHAVAVEMEMESEEDSGLVPRMGDVVEVVVEVVVVIRDRTVRFDLLHQSVLDPLMVSIRLRDAQGS